MGAGQGGVTAERYFDGGSEPAQAADGVAGGLIDERGFGQIHLRRDPRHVRIGKIVDLQTDGGRVAAERGIGKRVHGVEWNPSTGHFSLGLDGVVCKGRKAGDYGKIHILRCFGSLWRRGGAAMSRPKTG